ncbi:MAG TPA: hypothetical protein VMV94_09660 [Phycisphaerae bacterium]|nr:hypothetical protein [Phycisphaerae bacterium]
MGLPHDTVLASQNSGVMGYFMDLRMVNLDGLVNGRTLYEYLSRYGADIRQYLAEAQPISGYIDCIPPGGVPSYDAYFIGERRFVLVPLAARIDALYGKSETNSIRLYLSPSLAERTGLLPAKLAVTDAEE